MKVTVSTKCDCHYWANQHGAGFVMCEDHASMMAALAIARGLTLQEAFDEALDETFARMREEGLLT